MDDNDAVVSIVVYDGCDSLKWLGRRGFGDSEVSISINKKDDVFTQEALEAKKRGSLLYDSSAKTRLL